MMTQGHLLERGRKYDVASLQFLGWYDPAGIGTDGYHIDDYFRDGEYLGADQDGVEPLFTAG
jgi:hypothetical protein